MAPNARQQPRKSEHSPPPAPGAMDYGLLFLLASMWGASFLLIKIAVVDVPPMTLTFGRLLFASAVMWVALLATGATLPRTRQAWKLVIVASSVGTVSPFILVSWGQSGIDSGLTAILMGVMPLITMAIAHVVLPDDKMTPAKFAGLVCGLVGIVVLIGPAQLGGVGDGVLYQLAIIGTATCFAVSAVVTRKWMGQSSQLGLATAILTLSLILMIPIMLVVDGVPTSLPAFEPMLAISVLGTLQTGLGQLLLFAMLARQGPSFFSQINYVVPLMGVAWGAAVLGERLPLSAFTSLGLILLGLTVSRFDGRRQ